MRQTSILIFFIAMIMFPACEKDAEIQPRDYPFLVIDNVGLMPGEYVKVTASFLNWGNQEITDHGFLFEDKSFMLWIEIEVKESLGVPEKDKSTFSFTLHSGLVKDIRFRVRAYAKTTDYTVFSNEHIFISPIE